MERLRRNLRYLCDESRMLTGITAAYGTAQSSESILHGRAQEFRMESDGTVSSEVRQLDESALFDLASLTKLFTCVLAMQLIEQGRLSLDERISSIEPRFTHLQDVSVFDVMSFNACLQTNGRIDNAQSREDGLCRLFGTRRVPLPRIRLYSDINAMVMKYVIEKKANMPLADVLKKNILSPLGLDDTYAHVPESQRNRCVCYSYEHRIVKGIYKL